MRYNATIAGAFSGRLTSFLGGMVFNKNGTARAYSTPTNPQTANQQEVRAFFLFLTAAWKGLTPAQRTAWAVARTADAYAKTDPFTGTTGPYKSAKSLFIALNLNKAISNSTLGSPSVLFTDPGVPAAQDVITAVSVAIDASAQTVIATFTGTSSNENFVFRATPTLSPGNMNATSVRSQFRVVLGTSPTSPWAVSTEYLALFPLLTDKAGQKVFWVIEGVDISSGISRIIASGDTIVVA